MPLIKISAAHGTGAVGEGEQPAVRRRFRAQWNRDRCCSAARLGAYGVMGHPGLDPGGHWRPRGQGHDRHATAPRRRHCRPTDPPRPPSDLASPARSRAARRDPGPAAGASRAALTTWPAGPDPELANLARHPGYSYAAPRKPRPLKTNIPPKINSAHYSRNRV